MKKELLLLAVCVICTLTVGCESNTPTTQETHKGQCVEYSTEYKVDCGPFACSDRFCCERKYDVCVRWSE